MKRLAISAYFAIRLLAFLVAPSATSCNTSYRTSPPVDAAANWTSIAIIGGLDRITELHITGLLKSHGIDSSIEGSVVYGVSVPKQDAARSIAILKDDLQRHHYYIAIWDGKAYAPHPIAEPEWTETQPRQRYEDLIQLKQYRENTDVWAVLHHGDIKAELPAFAYVVKIKTLTREYVDGENHPQVGHEVEVELAVRLDEEIGGKRLSFQVWDNDRQIQKQGFDEWWTGEPLAVAVNRKRYDHREK